MRINRRSIFRLTLAAFTAPLFAHTSPATAATTQIVKLSKVKVGGNFTFQLPNGAPAVLFRTKTGVFAYQTICTHQGGQVNYLSASKLLVCSIHNASFDPFKKGNVVTGPAVNPLPTVKVKVAGSWIVLI